MRRRVFAATAAAAAAAVVPLVFPADARAAAPAPDSGAADAAAARRPPAVPLVAHDPYFSVWSFRDRLTDDWSRHWTGSVNALCGLARIDGKPYRWAGNAPQGGPAMTQTALEVTPTRSVYTFEAGGVRLKVTFLSPLLPDDLEMVSRPVTYLFFEAGATDGKEHQVDLYADTTAEWVVNAPSQPVTWGRVRLGGADVLKLGSAEQNVLGSVGDDRRIDWGWLYVAAPGASATALASDGAARGGFARTGALPDDDLRMPRPASDQWPVAAAAFALGKVGAKPESRTLVLAYDDEFALEYFHRPVRAYWRRGGADAGDLLAGALKNAEGVRRRAEAFDAALTKELEAVGGADYARLAVLSYRQAISAHKLAADIDGTLLFLSKENFSNGCIGTVDVTYPSAPLFLALNPALLKGMLTPILDYAESPRWKFPFAPHDLGTYPKANGQVYGGGERTEENQMPVEECGNMLILMAAVAKAEGSAEYSRRYWATLTKWAEYLKEKGLDPENQLCTDDFAGHLAHNANLSLKAIMALGSYAQLCDTLGKKPEAQQYRKVAEQMAKDWVKMAADGDHYKLAFDRPGTWSQKYNLVWDDLLNLDLFPDAVKRTEVAFYLKKQNPYGLPLDNRADYTKLDWIVWSATLAENRADFDALLKPVAKWLDEGPSRVPLTDWYDTKNGRQVGFQARSVVGGVYLPLLKARWEKRRGR